MRLFFNNVFGLIISYYYTGDNDNVGSSVENRLPVQLQYLPREIYALLQNMKDTV